MLIPLVKTVKDYIENFYDEILVTIFDARTGLTLASLEVGQLKEKGYFDNYIVKCFRYYNEKVYLLGVIEQEGNNNGNTKQIS